MRPSDLIRSRAFRLALFYVALFGISMSLLLGFVYWTAGSYLESHVDEFVQSEIDTLLADEAVDGREGLLGLIERRIAADEPHRWRYAVADASGRIVAGNLEQWPTQRPDTAGWYTLSDERAADEGRIRARAAAMAGGARLFVGLDDYELQELREALGGAMSAGLAVVLALAIGGGVLAAWLSLRQVEQINRAARQIMAGSMDKRMPVTGSGDEFDQLAYNINHMLDRINQLMQAVQGVADNIAHDLRAPLSRHRARLDSARNELGGDELTRTFVERSIEDVDSILQTFNSLLRIASVESGAARANFTELDLVDLVRDAEQMFEPVAADKSITLRAHDVQSATVFGHRDLLFQTLANLIDNAIKHSPRGSSVEISLRLLEDHVRLSVSDNGPGIPQAARKDVFRRLYRLDASRSTPGTGLGLSLVRSVAALHEGECRLEDNEPGTRAVLILKSR